MLSTKHIQYLAVYPVMNRKKIKTVKSAIAEAELKLLVEEGINKKDKDAINWFFTRFKAKSVLVKCESENHVIKLTKHGDLILTNHTNDDIDSQYAMRALGSNRRVCKCAIVRKNWIAYTTGKTVGTDSLPAELQGEAIRARLRHRKRSARSIKNNLNKIDQLKLPLTKRATVIGKFIEKVFNSNTELTTNGMKLSPKEQKTYEVKLIVAPPDKYNRKQQNSTKIKLTVPPFMYPTLGNSKSSSMFQYSYRQPAQCRTIALSDDWIDSVYKQDAMVIDKCLVTQLIRIPNSMVPNSSTHRAVVIKLGHKNSQLKALSIRHNAAVKARDGRWIIERAGW